MDSNAFDGIVRQAGRSGSRRQALRALAAAGLGLGVARAGFGAASAGGKKHVTDRCKSSKECAGSLACKKANSQNSCFGSTVERCCKPVGAKCNDGCECCGVDVICNGGYCDKA